MVEPCRKTKYYFEARRPTARPWPFPREFSVEFDQKCESELPVQLDRGTTPTSMHTATTIAFIPPAPAGWGGDAKSAD